jgi:hypothetical protein
VLPETDGARFAITGLYSTQHAVILRALAWGWHATRTPFPQTAEPYSWTALDDGGRWHVARQVNAPIGGISGHGYTDIALIPGTLHQLVRLRGHHGHLRLRQPADAEARAAQQVRRRDDRGQRPLRPVPVLQEPRAPKDEPGAGPLS